jgi:hypothetical protein
MSCAGTGGAVRRGVGAQRGAARRGAARLAARSCACGAARRVTIRPACRPAAGALARKCDSLSARSGAGGPRSRAPAAPAGPRRSCRPGSARRSPTSGAPGSSRTAAAPPPPLCDRGAATVGGGGPGTSPRGRGGFGGWWLFQILQAIILSRAACLSVVIGCLGGHHGPGTAPDSVSRCCLVGVGRWERRSVIGTLRRALVRDEACTVPGLRVDCPRPKAPHPSAASPGGGSCPRPRTLCEPAHGRSSQNWEFTLLRDAINPAWLRFLHGTSPLAHSLREGVGLEE